MAGPVPPVSYTAMAGPSGKDSKVDAGSMSKQKEVKSTCLLASPPK
jgi:hypothetical protein